MYIAKAMLIHNGKEYKAGQEVPLKDSEAKELLADRAVALIGDTAVETESKASKAATEAAKLKTKLAAAEKAATDEKNRADANASSLEKMIGDFNAASEKVAILEAQVKELTDKLAAAEKAAKPGSQ